MNTNKIEELCRAKEQELLHRYFGDLSDQAAIERPETIGEYTKELPLKIEAEFKDYLTELWSKLSDQPLVLEEQKLRQLMTDDDREAIDHAYEAASHITPLERLTKSNHKDITYYKGLLLHYTKDLLLVMRTDFLEEITNRHINCKAFTD